MNKISNTKGHIFSYHNLLQGEDLIISDFYKDKQIENIEDPEGGNTKKLPTSVPSPFAIIDLTASAFNILSKQDDLKGNLIYEKIVSQCWDVGMMFFNNLGLGEALQIIEWKREEEIENLLQSSIEGHRILGQTIQMYLKDDAIAYNFDNYQSIYLLKYNHNYFGGTSPKTLFYATLNPLEDDEENHINLGSNDILFDKEYAALYERSDDFQLYVYSLVKRISNFSSRCKELSDYLEKNKEIVKVRNRPLYEKIQSIKTDDYDKNYQPTSVGGAGSFATILDTPIRCKPAKEDGKSDFKIRTTKYRGKTPLVLFPGFGGQTIHGNKMTYFDCAYAKEIDDAIGFYDLNPIVNDRVIPGLTGVKYPCLYVDDLLEDTLFKTPSFEINEQHFFNASFNGEDVGFFLPIKAELFKYFDVEDIVNNTMDDGTPFFVLEERANDSIKATLRVPIQNGYMTLEKIYLSSGSIDKDKNIGVIKVLNLDINIFPFVKYNPLQELYSQQKETCEFRTNFLFFGTSKIPKLSFFRNDGEQLDAISSKLKGNPAIEGFQTFITQKYYDYLSLDIDDKKAVIVPLWYSRNTPSNTFHFAIDFGTTNTHIEYKKNGGNAEVFSLSSCFGRLSKQFDVYKSRGDKEFIPDFIDPTTNFRFSQRTIIAATKTLDYRQPTYALADFRIPFYYEYQDHTPTSDYHTNLKWANYAVESNNTSPNEQEQQVSAFLEQIILMLKAKVLSEEGNLKNTQFTWFYPSSMTTKRIGSLEKFWIKLLEKHFYIPHTQVKKIPESIAPFAYYLNNEGIDSLLYPAVTIDIGGGTSDMVIFKEDKPLHLTSFRFAGNSIFGDGYNSNPKQNGFVIKYKETLKDLLETNRLSKLVGALKSIENGSSADIIAFFMSLEENIDVKGKHNISFQKLLSNDAILKTTILLFYHGLIYHLANYLKKSELEMPGVLVFSGKGGNLIKLLDDSIGYTILSEYTIQIFNKVFEKEHSRSLSIILSDNPKAVTCKGGLDITQDLIDNSTKITKIITGAKEEPLVLPKYPELDKSNTTLNSVVEEVKEAFQQFFDINDDFNYYHNFEINAGALKSAKEILLEEGAAHVGILKGVNEKKKELGDNSNIKIEETLFFYAYRDLLNKLAYRLVQGK